MRPRRSNFWKVFSIPLAIGLVSVTGLFSALLGDGAWDVLSWIGLGIRCGSACAGCSSAERKLRSS